jgi:surfeit locus 1 family protein
VKQVRQVLRALFSRKWWWVTLLVVALMMVLARLGFWQLDRLGQRRVNNAIVAAALAASPLDLFGATLPDDLSTIKDRQVTATGEYDLDNQLVLKVQNWDGRAGAHLITPLLLADGETAVLVDRGWIPEMENNPVDRAKYDVAGLSTVEGYAALSQTLLGGKSSMPEEPQMEWYRVDIAAIQAQMPYELLPIYVLQAPEDNLVPPFRRAPDIDLSEGSHLGYALQWFTFCLGLGIAYVVYVRKYMIESKST